MAVVAGATQSSVRTSLPTASLPRAARPADLRQQYRLPPAIGSRIDLDDSNAVGDSCVRHKSRRQHDDRGP